MAVDHRKLLSEQDSNQTNATCSDCGPTCPYKCSYPEIYWPPQPQPLPPQTTTDTTTTTTFHISPYFIIILALLGSACLFISYYLIMVRCCTRFRRPPTTQVYSEAEEEFSDEEHGLEVDHPIWHITTVGLQPSVINSITVIKYSKGDNLIECTDCSVCLSEFQDDETLRLLPKCNHAFHIPCIDTWLTSHTNCPLCRAGILSNTWSAALSPNDRSFSNGAGSNRNIQTENSENDGELDGGNCVPESQVFEDIEDSKTEYESVMTTRRSISMDSVVVAEIVLGENEGDSGDAARLSRPRSAEEIEEDDEEEECMCMGGG